MRRSLALLTALVVVCFATAGFAQTSCPAPTIVQTGGSNPSCAADAVTLDAGAGWVTYQWSNGATTQTITDAPAANTTYTVTVTDANGCSVTSQPLTLNVLPKHVPEIRPEFSQTACPDGPTHVAIFDPAGVSWTSYQWSVTNGTIIGPSDVRYPQINAGHSGTVTITLHVTEDGGCPSTASIDIPIQAPPPPPITAPASVCPGGTNVAQVDPFCCSNSLWTISGGTLQPDGVNGGPHTNRVYFNADGSGPVTLTYSGTIDGCTATNSVTIPLSSVPSPIIYVMNSPTCATAPDRAITGPPQGVTYAAYSWSIAHGVIDSGANTDDMSFHGDGSGQPIVLTLDVIDGNGCSARASKSVDIRGIPNPRIRIDKDPTCPNGVNYASLDGPAGGGRWASVVWSIANASVLQDSGEYLQFRADGSGPVTLTAAVTDATGCTATATATIALKTITPDLRVAFASATPATANRAWVPAPVSGSYTSYLWSIDNGTIDNNDGDFVYFHGDPSGPTTITVTVVDSDGCSGTSSVAVPLATIPTPNVTVYQPYACPNEWNIAFVSVPTEGWASIAWSVTNATIIGSSNQPSIDFRTDGTAPATVSVVVTDASGAQATQSVTIPLYTTPPPITVSRPSACAGGWTSAYIDPQYGTFSYHWSVTNARLDSWPYDRYATFIPDGTGPVTVTVNLTTSGGCQISNSTVVPLQTLATPTMTLTDPMPADRFGSGYAQILDPNGIYTSFNWSATHATFGVGGPDMHYVTIYPDGTGPVKVTCVVSTNEGCQVTVSREALLAGNSLMIDVPAATYCGPVTRTASLFPDSGLTNIQWSISNGSIVSGANGYTATFHANGGADANLTATAVNGSGQTISASKVVSYVPLTATLSGPSYYCPQYYSNFTVDATAPITNVAIASAQNCTTLITGPNTFAARVVDPSQPISVTITATTSEGCQTSASVTEPGVDAVFGPVIALDHPGLCPNGSGHATITNVQPNVSYHWQITNGVLDSEMYATSVTFHATGTSPVTLQAWANPYYSICSAVKSVTIPVTAPSATITGPTTFCAGGSATLTASAGSSYLWSNGATTQSITVNAAGTYSVTVTDGNGCTASASQSVSVNAAPAPQIVLQNHYNGLAPATDSLRAASTSSTFNYCGSVDITLTVNQFYSSYLWSTGERTPSIHVTSGGTYTVTVTNVSGCTGSDTAVVNVTPYPPAPAITASAPDLCPNSSVTLTSTAADSYLWSNGATTRSITMTQAGTYSVSATVNGCSASSQPYTVSQRAATITASGPTTFCAPGSVTLTASAGASYLWSNGATTQSINVTTSGNYSVTVTYADGCAVTTDAVPVTAGNIAVTLTADKTTICPGGSIHLTATVTGGPAASFRWWTGTQYVDGTNTLTITPGSSGYADVSVLDANGCGATAYVIYTVEQPAATITVSGPTPYCGGPVTLTANDGASYLWSNGETTKSIQVTESGSYTVTVTTAAGCTATSAPATATINTIPPKPVITTSGSTSFCPGGSVTLTAPASPYAYVWSTGATTQSINVTTTGTYTVSLVNAGICTSTSDPITVAVNAPVQPAITPSGSTTFCAGGSVTLTSSAASSYVWSTGATTQSINVTGTGDYSVTTVDANGCSATSSATHVQVNAVPAKPVITYTGNTTFCDGGSITLTAPAGYTYSWSNGATTQSINVTSTGDYSVTVSNGNCTATSDAVHVQVNAVPAKPVITYTGSTTFCDGGSITLTAPSGYTYSWSNGATTQSINVTSTGNYSVTVSNGNCTATSDAVHVQVNTVPAKPAITYTGSTTFCDGGSITLNAPAGYTYLWSNNATTQSINVTSTGNYSVTVSNGNCTATSDAVHVQVNTVPAKPAITYTGSTTFCDGGSITLNAPAGYTYLWSNNATTQSINVTSTGDYTVTVSNGNCTATSDAVHVQVNTVPAKPAITYTGSTTFCDGGSITLTAPAGYSSYLWSNNQTAQSIVVTSTGNYSVKVSNGFCQSPSSDAVPVTVNTVPAKPTITYTGNTTFCQGGSITLTAPAGYNSYLWSNNATTQSIVVTATGDYSVKVSNANCQSVSSDAVHVQVNPPIPVITPSSAAICPGSSATLTAPAGYTYRWSNGKTTQSIIVTSAGNYTVTITSGSCSATSAPASVTVKTTTSLQQPANITILRGATGTLSANAQGTNLTYQWYSGTTGNTSTPLGTSATQSVGPYTVKGKYTFWVRVTGDCGTASSNNVNVTVN